MKKECNWIKFSICEKWLHENYKFSPELALIVDTTTVRPILKNVGNIQRMQLDKILNL
jgi:hypothetical protein